MRGKDKHHKIQKMKRDIGEKKKKITQVELTMAMTMTKERDRQTVTSIYGRLILNNYTMFSWMYIAKKDSEKMITDNISCSMIGYLSVQASKISYSMIENFAFECGYESKWLGI